MQQEASEPEFHELLDILTGHMAYRRRNSGRYIALFLWEYLIISSAHSEAEYDTPIA
jgi:hypothetical protein